MRIRIVLPVPAHVPVGGFKVAYEYANRLVAKGHSVDVIHMREFDIPWNPFGLLKGWRSDRIWTRRFKEYFGWFPYDSRLSLKVLRAPFHRFLPPVDCSIATAWTTARFLASTPREQRGRSFYLIQHFEEWDGEKDDVLATWKLPLRKIVIARWLAKIAEEQSETSIHIPNGLDFEEFGSDVPPSERDPHRVAMLWHDYEWKGSREGLRALDASRGIVPTLKAEFFGTNPPPPDLPEWVTYHQAPSRKALREMFNRCSIFVGPSHAEGWPLPPAEAMTCGCAPVLTDIGGHVEYAVHERNALLTPVKDVEAMSTAITSLLLDSNKRIRLAETACADIHQFTWDRASSKLESVLSEP